MGVSYHFQASAITGRVLGIIIGLYAFASLAQQGDEFTFKALKKEPYYYDLKKALRHADKVYKLDLSKNNLSGFPASITQLTELRYLLLDNNNISTIPAEIAQLQKLQVLSLENNQLQELPSDLRLLSELYYLNLGHNKLDRWESKLFLVRNLSQLYLNHNGLKSFPAEIKQMKELTKLDIRGNEIDRIPGDIAHLYNLTSLNLSNNKLTGLPEELFLLSNLERLSLGNNEISSLPEDIFKLKNLEKLLIDSNHLSRLPESLYKLGKLKALDISYNQIDSLPQGISNLVSLEGLGLSNNPFTDLPLELAYLKKLQELYLKDLSFGKSPQVLYDLQNKGVKILDYENKDLFKARVLLSSGNNNLLLEDYEQAIEDYQLLLLSDTNNVTALYGLAQALINTAEYDAATSTCRRALRKDPPVEILDKLRALLRNSINHSTPFEASVDNYRREIEKYPDSAGLYYQLGLFYFDLQKHEEASNVFLKAINVDTDHANSHFYLAVSSHILDQDTSFILSAIRFLLLESSDVRATTILPFLLLKLKMRTGKKGITGSTAYYDSYIIRNERNEVVYKNETPYVDVFIAMIADLIPEITLGADTLKENPFLNTVMKEVLMADMNNVEIFQKKLASLLATEKKEIGAKERIAWNYYTPFFNSLVTNGYMESLAYYINHARRPEPYIKKWLKKNPNKITDMKSWVKAYDWKNN